MALQFQILRDPRESTKKCSLTPLRGHPQVSFRKYDPDRQLSVPGYLYLTPEGEELSPEDAGHPVLLIDCSWRRVPALLATVEGPLIPRRLPVFQTAYPRKSSVFNDPDTGLASVEALYATSVLLGQPEPSLLADYRWREQFLELNPSLRI
ncbi:MAG: pre-rRNA-processing protein TSR3 [Planctomycetota bacterium]|jgi:pre-rRNA-processing protein TSR3